ncbi:MAG: hypothetical protein IRZ08_09400 [Frankia sp.]|nr:hypothetical protein [Frankia sp.]
MPGPEGRDLATVTATIEERCRAAADLLASARNAPPAERAGLALAVLDLVADYEEAQALLAASVTPPGPVTVARGAGAVEVSWVPSPTPGVRYRVLRIGPDGTTRAVGVTGETRIDDGGVPSSAELPSYEVRAGVGNFWSQPAVWPQPQPAPQLRPEPAPAGATGAVVGGGPGPAAAPVAAGSAGASAAPSDADGEATRVLARTAADALDPAADLVVAGGLLRWRWPEGCTEVMVVWRPDAPPVAADDRAAESRKVTNVRYELDGGFRLPATRPLHVAVFTCVRDAAGRLVVATLAPPSARRHLSAREHL